MNLWERHLAAINLAGAQWERHSEDVAKRGSGGPVGAAASRDQSCCHCEPEGRGNLVFEIASSRSSSQ